MSSVAPSLRLLAGSADSPSLSAQEIVYPLLYSAISLRSLSLDTQNLIVKAPSTDRPAHPDQELLLDFLRSSPSLASQVVSLQVLTWKPKDFALFPNLRHFDCAWEVRSKLLVPLEVKPKLWSLKVRVGLEEYEYDEWSSPCGDMENDLESFESCIDTSELKYVLCCVFSFASLLRLIVSSLPLSRSLTLLYRPEEEPFHTLHILPSLHLPSLTSLTLQQNSGKLADYIFPSANFESLLQAVGSQLLHLSLHEDNHDVHYDLGHEPWIFPLCPNLLSFAFSGPYHPQSLIDTGHASLQTISIGRPYLRTKIVNRWREGEMTTIENQEDVEWEYNSHVFKFTKAVEENPKVMKERKGRSATPEDLEPKEGLVAKFPSMKTLRLRGISFQKEDVTEKTASFVSYIQRELGWDVKDKFETSWSEKFDPDYRSPLPELPFSEDGFDEEDEESDEYDDRGFGVYWGRRHW